MPGLIREPAPIDPQVAPQGAAPDQFLDNAFKIMYESEESLMEVLQPLETEDPVAGLAYATLIVVTKLLGSAEGAGKQLDPALVSQGAHDIMDDISKISVARGGREFSEEEMLEALALFEQLVAETSQSAASGGGLLSQGAQ